MQFDLFHEIDPVPVKSVATCEHYVHCVCYSFFIVLENWLLLVS